MGLGGVSGIIGHAVSSVIILIVLCGCRIAMELYEAVSSIRFHLNYKTHP